MKVLHGLETVEPPLPRSVLTIGNFDGVHLAHRALLQQARNLAAPSQVPVVALTFEPHPLTIVSPQRAPERLTTAPDKIRLLGEAGADVIVVARSEPSLMTTEAEDFVRQVLVAKFHPLHIIEGDSFGFGRGRRGDVHLLQQMAPECGYTVDVVEPVLVSLPGGDSVVVSSSGIRELLRAGRVEYAAACLGRSYELIGAVVEGDRRGRQIGFPTANLAVADLLVPGDGVYAGYALVGRQRYPAAISIGRKPTFGGGPRAVEAYLVGFSGDLYGQDLRIGLERFLRGQRPFELVEALQAQLARDVEAVTAGPPSHGGTSA